MSDNGFVYAYRKAWSHPAFRDYLDASVWNYYYQNAAWRDCTVYANGFPIALKRGQIFVSYRHLAAQFCCGEKRIRRLTDDLTNAAMADAQATHRGVLLTIRNYDEYQIPPDEGDAPPPQAETQNRRRYGRTSNKEELNKEKKDTEMPQEFILLWQSFPKKRTGNKAKALAAWKRACQRDSAEAIQAGADVYAKSDEVAKGFEKGLEAWLNDDRWKREYGATKPQFTGRRGFCP